MGFFGELEAPFTFHGAHHVLDLGRRRVVPAELVIGVDHRTIVVAPEDEVDQAIVCCLPGRGVAVLGVVAEVPEIPELDDVRALALGVRLVEEGF